MPINIGPLIPSLRDLAERTQRSREHREEFAEVLRGALAADADAEGWAQAIQGAIKTAEGWSGARPVGEPLNAQIPFGALPDRFALIAVDGSQINPNRHAAVQFAYVQAGAAAIVYGAGDGENTALAAAVTASKQKRQQLDYDDVTLFDKNGELLSAGAVANKRDQLEITFLADLCETFAAAGVRPIALADGNLIPFALLNELYLRNSRKEARALCDLVVGALDRMRKAKAIVAGYIDRPGSPALARACALYAGRAQAATKQSLQMIDERMPGLSDGLLLAPVLRPGHRGALFDPGWLVNGGEWLGRWNHSMQACYANFGADPAELSIIGRIEAPVWCAAPADLAIVTGVLRHHVNLGAGYPFILKAAHEESVVTKQDQHELEEHIQFELRDRGISTALSLKQSAKDAR